MKKLILFIAILLGFIRTQAQNPFAEYGYEPKIATLSQGQFIETFDNDTIVQIGSVLFNTKSKQIVAFVQTDTMYSEATLQPDIVSRWMSPDPLADHPTQIGLSPYHFVGNNPILWTDPDGRCPWCIAALKGAVQEYVTQVAFNVAEGKGWNSLIDVDGKEIVKSAIIDGATLGLGTLVKSGKTAIKVINHLDKAQDAKKVLTKVDDAGALVKQNQKSGALREAAEKVDLQKANPNATVQGQNYLRDANGKIVKDPVTGEGRRVDFTVIENGKATDMIETTSQNANKTKQLDKENRIREAGGTFVKDRGTGKLIDVKDVQTRVSRRD